ncbi:hypothetical protein V1512DRAFT_284550 [Lipomyces arxii]|uniref:uncharacterized protein n=1 Tax=Lipomyces arxii TaxID=56418 RepID=UPI0034CF9B12
MDKPTQSPQSPSMPSPNLIAASLISPRSPSSPGSTRGRARSSSIADLLATPPPVKPNAVVEDWQSVKLQTLMENDKLVSITGDVPVATAYEKLVDHNFTSLPVLLSPDSDPTEAESFDYSDISALLLLVMGHLKPSGTQVPENLEENVTKARQGFDVPVSFVMELTAHEPFITLQGSETLLTAVEYFGRGVHRLLVTNDAETQVLGLLSQRRLVKFIWDNARRFNSLETLFASSLQDLGLGGAGHVISIGGDKLVVEALEKMLKESVSSIAVVDGEGILLGNISIVDVKHLTKSTSAHLLNATCLQFLTVILTDRGLENGKDSYPVFHVTPLSTLAHTIAKLVATKSHRMWIVQPAGHYALSPTTTPSPSTPSSAVSPSTSSQQLVEPASPSLVPVTQSTQLPTSNKSGKVIGVISLTDILSLLARVAGKGDVDPSEARRQRRRSSSSSVRSFTLDSSSAVAAKARRSVSIERPGFVGRGSMDRGPRR